MDPSETAAQKILEAIDNDNLVAAERQLSSALEKNPTSQGLRAAQALLFFHHDELESCIRVSESITAETITSRAAWSALGHVLHRTCQWEGLSKVYEAMLAKMPEDQSVIENLTLTYVRLGRYEDVQKNAMSLFRKSGKPLHQAWGVMANMLIVPLTDSTHLFLKIAAKMLDANILQNSPNLQTAKMYFEVLMRQNLFDAAKDFVLSARGKHLGLHSTRLEAIHTVAVQTKDWGTAAAVGLELWRNEPDNWTLFRLYLSAIRQQEETGPSTVNEVTLAWDDGVTTYEVHKSFSQAEQFASSLVTIEIKGESKKYRRGPFLAEMELCFIQKKDLLALLTRYLQYFASKPCCFLDVSIYASSCVKDASWYRQLSGVADQDFANLTLQQHSNIILSLKIELVTYDTSKEASTFSLIARCLEGYQAARPLSTELTWSEEGLCDGYLTVALNVVLRHFAASKKLSWLILGLGLLQGVDRKKNNPAWLMLSVLFHRTLGLLDAASMQQLDFKSVQWESMAHVGLQSMLEVHALGKARDWCLHSEYFFSNNEQELAKLRAKVFQHTSFTKLAEIEEFKKTLVHSISRMESHIHGIVLGLSECETKRDIVRLLAGCTQALLSLLSLGSDVTSVQSNEDYKVLGSLLLVAHGSPDEEKLRSALLPNYPQLTVRICRAQFLVSVLSVLHDLVQHQRQAEHQKAAKPQHGKRGKNAPPPVATENLTFVFLKEKHDFQAYYAPCVQSIQQADPDPGWRTATELFVPVMELISGGDYSKVETISAALQNLQYSSVVFYPFFTLMVPYFSLIEDSKIPSGDWCRLLSEKLEKIAITKPYQADFLNLKENSFADVMLKKAKLPSSEKILTELCQLQNEQGERMQVEIQRLALEYRTIAKISGKKR